MPEGPAARKRGVISRPGHGPSRRRGGWVIVVAMRPLRCFLSHLVVLAVVVSCAASAVHAQSLDCQAVRRTRVLARAHGVDAANLVALERATCGGIANLPLLFAVQRPSEDCLRMTAMHALAAAAGGEDLAQIDGTRVAVCRAGNLGDLDEWPNGRRIRTATAWVYPSGRRFTGVGRTLRYPSGETARAEDGSWRYPNGRTVDPRSRRFHLPSGRVVDSERELIAWTCSRLGAERCEGTLDELPAAWADVRGALITMLAWEARETD